MASAKMLIAVGAPDKASHCLGRWMVVFAGDKGGETAVAQGATPAASQPDVRFFQEREG